MLPSRAFRIPIALVAVIAVLGASGPVQASASPPDPPAAAAHDGWEWPVQPFRLERAFVQPAHRYGAGHRGIDLRPLAGDDVHSPADGVIAFAGVVAGRSIVTIDHEGGLVTTLEPVESDLVPGAAIGAGDLVGRLSAGGHAEPGSVHFGVRLDGEYVNPLLLLGGVPRAVLLPCCA